MGGVSQGPRTGPHKPHKPHKVGGVGKRKDNGRLPGDRQIDLNGADMIDGIELSSLRQRRSPTGDTYFTGRLGSALIVLVRDDVERDVWRLIATDPSRASSRNEPVSPARLPARPADEDGWYQTDMNDDLPEGVTTE